MVGEDTHLSRFGRYVDLDSILATKVSAGIPCNEIGALRAH